MHTSILPDRWYPFIGYVRGCVCVCPTTQAHMAINFKNKLPISIKLTFYITCGNDPVLTCSGNVGICMKNVHVFEISLHNIILFVSSGWALA